MEIRIWYGYGVEESTSQTYSTIPVTVCRLYSLAQLAHEASELGLLVWQDFQFACGVYPAHDKFVDSVKKEAEVNVKRMRHHACLALWCGNNEGADHLFREVRGLNCNQITSKFSNGAVGIQ